MATDATVLTQESSPSDILKSLTPEQRKTWREKGDLPELPPKKEKIETAPAESSPAAKTAVTEPAGEPAKTPAEPVPAKTEPKAKGAESRIKELLADNKRLNAELETLRKAATPVPAKKTEETAKPHRNDVEEKTGQPKYATDDEFLDARDKYVFEQASKKTREDIADEQKAASIEAQNKLLREKWQNSLKIATERHPDFAKVCEIDSKGAFQNAELKSIKDKGILDAWILDSEIGGQILYYLASHPGEVKRFDSLNPFNASRELTKLEDKLSGTTSASPEKKEEKHAEGSPATKVTGAPAPAATVGGKATAPVDEIEAALKAEDFRRYQKAANEEEFRRKKTG